MKKNKGKIVSLWLSGFAIVLSTAALLCVFLKVEPFGWGMFGGVVAVLSLLVVVLIGFQIYSAVNFEEKRKQMFDIVAESELQGKYMHSLGSFITNQAIAMVHYNMKDIYSFLKYGIYTINEGMNIGQKIECNTMLKAMNEVCANGIILTSFEQSNLLKFLYNIKDINKLEGYRELEKSILRAEISEESTYSQLDF